MRLLRKNVCRYSRKRAKCCAILENTVPSFAKLRTVGQASSSSSRSHLEKNRPADWAAHGPAHRPADGPADRSGGQDFDAGLGRGLRRAVGPGRRSSRPAVEQLYLFIAKLCEQNDDAASARSHKGLLRARELELISAQVTTKVSSCPLGKSKRSKS